MPAKIAPIVSITGVLGPVAAGFVTTFVLSVATDLLMHRLGVFPPSGERMADGMFIIPAIYRILFTIAGGFVAARIASRNKPVHAWALAILGSVIGVLTLVVYLGNDSDAYGPLWYALSIPLSAAPAILAGAWLAGAWKQPAPEDSPPFRS